MLNYQRSAMRRKLLKENWRYLLILMIINDISHLQAEPTFFEKRAEGWHWYELLRNGDVQEDDQTDSSDSLPQTPTEEIEVQRKELEEKLHAAIIKPTQENITAYLLLQKALMDQSEKFSNEWRRVVMMTPSLDETLVHPVDQNARSLYYSEQKKELESRIKSLSKEFGLFFFFRHHCPYCHQFAPIVKRFSEKYGWSVLAISLDRESSKSVLPWFPHAKRDNGIAGHLQITQVPALIAIHPATKQLIPLAYGMISEGEIEGRIDLLTRTLQGAKK